MRPPTKYLDSPSDPLNMVGRDPILLGNDHIFLKGHGDSGGWMPQNVPGLKCIVPLKNATGGLTLGLLVERLEEQGSLYFPFWRF